MVLLSFASLSNSPHICANLAWTCPVEISFVSRTYLSIPCVSVTDEAFIMRWNVVRCHIERLVQEFEVRDRMANVHVLALLNTALPPISRAFIQFSTLTERRVFNVVVGQQFARQLQENVWNFLSKLNFGARISEDRSKHYLRAFNLIHWLILNYIVFN